MDSSFFLVRALLPPNCYMASLRDAFLHISITERFQKSVGKGRGRSNPLAVSGSSIWPSLLSRRSLQRP